MSSESRYAHDLANYNTSTDYSRLAELAKTKSIICVVDYTTHSLTTRDIARTFYQGPRQEYWSVGVRGMSYLTAFSLAEFIALCAILHLEFLDPVSP